MFENLEKELSLTKNRDDKPLKDNFMNVLLSYCENGDSRCIEKADEIDHETREFMSIQHPESGRIDFEYPEGFDSSLEDAMEAVLHIVGNLNRNNLDDTLNEITNIGIEIEQLEDVDESFKYISLAAVSVAKESTKLWHRAFYDETSPYHDYLRVNREEDDIPFWGIGYIIGADIVGAILIPVAKLVRLSFLMVLLLTSPIFMTVGLICAFAPFLPFCFIINLSFDFLDTLFPAPFMSVIAYEQLLNGTFNISDFASNAWENTWLDPP